MEDKQAYELMKALTKEGRYLLGTLPLGADLVGSETTTEVVVNALRANGIEIDETRTNAVDEDPDFVAHSCYKEQDSQFFPFPMNLSKTGNPVIHRDVDFWQYDLIGSLEIELENGVWNVYLTFTLWCP